MAWNDEIQEAAYTSPSGKRQTFIYENVSRETELKTATFTFPEMDGALVQSLGLGGRIFPLKCIFSGSKCIKEANSFENLLKERGYGILEHPVYGRMNVVPTGNIKRIDNLIDGANEAVVEVTFSETIINMEFPTSEVAVVDSLDAAMDAYEDSAVTEFAEKIQTETVNDKTQLQQILSIQTDYIFKDIQAMSVLTVEGKKNRLSWLKEAKKFLTETESNIDRISLYANEIARTVTKTIQLPAKIAINATSKLASYAAIIKDIKNCIKADAFGAKAVTNQYAVTQLTWGSSVASLSYGTAKTAYEKGRTSYEKKQSDSYEISVSNTGGFLSRTDVLEAMTQIIDEFDMYSAYIDSQNKKNMFIDTGETYEKLLNVVVYSLRALEEATFNLPFMRVIKLDRDRQFFELLTELYGKDGFNRQDQFISDNKLTADEIVLIPMGREVRYYA